jgi:hypothetical protein
MITFVATNVFVAEQYILHCDIIHSCRCLPMFLRNILSPPSMKVELLYTSKTLVTTCKTTHHNPEDHHPGFKAMTTSYPISLNWRYYC